MRKSRRHLKCDTPIDSRGNSKINEFVYGEPLTEPVLFEGHVIYPCCCIVPLITDAEVGESCREAIAVSIYDILSPGARAMQDIIKGSFQLKKNSMVLLKVSF